MIKYQRVHEGDVVHNWKVVGKTGKTPGRSQAQLMLVECLTCGHTQKVRLDNLKAHPPKCHSCFPPKSGDLAVPGKPGATMFPRTPENWGDLNPSYHTLWVSRLRSSLIRARETGREFSLTPVQYYTEISKPCSYCGVPSIVNGEPTHGLDRVDNNKGYSIDNVASCCIVCNRAKGNRTRIDFIDWATNIYRNCMEPFLRSGV